MGLGSSIFARAVDLVRSTTESLGFQGEVLHEARLGQDAVGEKAYAAVVPRLACIAEGEQQLLTKDGRTVRTKAVITFFPAAAGEAPPEIGLRDRLTLPSGLVGVIVEIPQTATDPETGAPLIRVAWLG
jgi:hypothetical protein